MRSVHALLAALAASLLGMSVLFDAASRASPGSGWASLAELDLALGLGVTGLAAPLALASARGAASRGPGLPRASIRAGALAGALAAALAALILRMGGRGGVAPSGAVAMSALSFTLAAAASWVTREAARRAAS